MVVSKQLGLKLFADDNLRKDIEEIMGVEFVEACIDLAITVCPPEPNCLGDKSTNYKFYRKKSPLNK